LWLFQQVPGLCSATLPQSDKRTARQTLAAALTMALADPSRQADDTTPKSD